MHTLMSVDVERFVGLVFSGHDCWSLPLQILAALLLLYSQARSCRSCPGPDRRDKAFCCVLDTALLYQSCCTAELCLTLLRCKTYVRQAAGPQSRPAPSTVLIQEMRVTVFPAVDHPRIRRNGCGASVSHCRSAWLSLRGWRWQSC